MPNGSLNGRNGTMAAISSSFLRMSFGSGPFSTVLTFCSTSAGERARRRFNEIIARGGTARYEDVLAKVIERDRIDSTRDVAPLKAAEDAVVIDSDKMSIEEVFEKVLALCQ